MSRDIFIGRDDLRLASKTFVGHSSALPIDNVSSAAYSTDQCVFVTERERERSTETVVFARNILSVAVEVQCCFTSTETVRNIREGGAQDGHFDFHTVFKL